MRTNPIPVEPKRLAIEVVDPQFSLPDFFNFGKRIHTKDLHKALDLLGLNFTVSQHTNIVIDANAKPVYDAKAKAIILSVDSDYNGLLFSKQRPIVRDDTKEVICNMGDGYKIVQNEEIAIIMGDMINHNKNINIIHGGIVRNCEKLTLSANIEGITNIGPDKVSRIITLLWSHTGHRAVEISFSFFLHRGGIFLNTKTDNKQTFKWRHTKNVSTRINDAKKALQMADDYYTQMERIYQNFLSTPMSVDSMDKFLEALFGGEGKDGRKTRGMSRRDSVMTTFQSVPNTISQTRWAAFTSIAHFVDKENKPNASEEFSEAELTYDNVCYGSGAQIKQDAFSLLLTMK